MIELLRGSVLVRTWFQDDASWASLVSEIEVPSDDGFLADVSPVSDPAFEGLSAERLTAEHPGGAIVCFIADETTLTVAEHPILSVWVLPRRPDDDGPEPTPFRVVPSELWGVENNINMANMDWTDFTGSVGKDGVFRGF